jgi:myo-inositol-1(or 4)-monophosphatase
MRDDRSKDFECLRYAAREAGRVARSYWGRSIEKGRKADGSAVTEADHAVDALLCERLRGARPDYGWLSEESADHEGRRDARRVWVVDPIDGTRAFIQGRDDWTVAVALVEDGAPVLAALVNPLRDETYEARAGEGAFLNGRRIQVSERSELPGAKLIVPEPLLKANRWRTPWPAASLVWANSILYRMALVACGEADATFALKPKWEWDVAAGALLVSEAGGLATEPGGSPLRFNSPEAKVRGFLASGAKLHQILLERMGEAL